MRALAAAVVLLASVPLWAAPFPIEKEQSFAAARAALLRAGWKPVRKAYVLDDGTPENNYGDAAKFFSAGIREVQFCSGTGNNYCVHNYRSGRHCLRVATLGEYGVGSGPQVEAWYSECPRRLP